MRAGSEPSTERIYLLVTSLDATGGIARTVHNLANHLVERHQVEIIGLRRWSRGQVYPLDPRVKRTYLLDGPGRWVRKLDAVVTRLDPRRNSEGHNALTDVLLRRKLRSLDPGVVVSTRPMIHLAAVRFAPEHHILIGQDHLNYERRQVRGAMRLLHRAVRELDSFVVLTEADACDYRTAFPEAAGKIRVIPNAAPWPVSEPAPTNRKVIVAAGRLVGQKGFDRLIAAYAPIARTRPGWQLHIYGEGPRHDRFARMIRNRKLDRRIVLKGWAEDFERVLENAAIYAMTSRFEGFPMVLVEAMSKGVPAVSFDCPRGPAEIIVDGHNGRLVPDGDLEAFRSALLQLMDDTGLRQRMAVWAAQTASAYRIEPIVARWEELFDELLQARQQPEVAMAEAEHQPW
jgi:glycosyltransferase involved in cell wall biosynthesis